ncbi:MAG: MFS transporter [Bacteroidales bacterium]|nr:MFS transporter [Bacteroidales bacterium]
MQTTRLHYGYIILICCCLMMGVNIGITFSCAGIFYQPVSQSLGVAVGTFGLYMSLMYIASTLMLSVAGRWIEKYSARYLLAGSSAIMGLTLISMAIYNAVWQFYVAGCILGLTVAFLLYLSFPTLINRWFRIRVGLLMGVCSAASGIGGMIFNPIAGYMIENCGWRWAYAIFGILVLVIISPLLLLLLRDYPADKGLLPVGESEAVDTPAVPDATSAPARPASGIEYAKAVRMPLFYAVFIFAFLMMAISTLNLFIPGYVSSLSFAEESAAWVASAVMTGVTIGKLALGHINDRNSLAGVLVTTLAGAAGLFMLIEGDASLAIIVAGAFLFGWAYAGVTVQTAMLTRTLFGNRDYARIYAIISIALAAGGALASGGWGLLADATGFKAIFATGALLLVLCAMLGAFPLIKKGKAGVQ